MHEKRKTCCTALKVHLLTIVEAFVSIKAHNHLIEIKIYLLIVRNRLKETAKVA